ncbi:selenocysteine-specific elongation factor [Sabethes cyaneus]|uniref:selenocysteine-specific elongation factor n=1 Tax=Sabethes cyaneus TaxID=53552 RepID=UPI00237EC53C|nr:selenocysteine-specific elongation factor [Sabethes cyaneus]
MQMQKNVLNLNIGLLGHVDSGKTSLAKALSEVASTASFDKNPQSQQRGITLDLGFSALQLDLPEKLKCSDHNWNRLQYTFVDCPGHASLIRTIIGGAQIIDIMILVIDVSKGIQTQTAECLVIGELTCSKIIVALNKIDTLEEEKRFAVVGKMRKGISKVLEKTIFAGAPVIEISANAKLNLDKLIEALKDISCIPERDVKAPFLFAVDHCFAIRGQGTVCTGTVLQGQINVNDDVEISKLKIIKKVKSIQMFKQNQSVAQQGDRIGISITQFDPKQLERGLLCKPGYVMNVYAAVIRLTRIKYYNRLIRNKAKFHISCGHETALATVTLFKGTQCGFDEKLQYEYLEEYGHDSVIESTQAVFALLEFEQQIQVAPNALLLGSKLDTDIQTNQCRLAFFGRLELCSTDKDYISTFLPRLKIYKEKSKIGTIQRVVNEFELIATGLFKKDGNNRQDFLGFRIRLSTGEWGVIEDTFGASSKVKLRFMKPLAKETLDRLQQKNKLGPQEPVQVELKFKKFFSKKCITSNKVIQ